jgi:hypothetical protein
MSKETSSDTTVRVEIFHEVDETVYVFTGDTEATVEERIRLWENYDTESYSNSRPFTREDAEYASDALNQL